MNTVTCEVEQTLFFSFEQFIDMGSEEEYAAKHRGVRKQIVCRHWLNGLCKKGEKCDWLHEIDLSKMQVCLFEKKGHCSAGDDCIFRHPKEECKWYNQGFCKQGSRCQNKHFKQSACPLFLIDACPDGDNCTMPHPKLNLQPRLSVGGKRIIHRSQKTRFALNFK